MTKFAGLISKLVDKYNKSVDLHGNCYFSANLDLLLIKIVPRRQSDFNNLDGNSII